MAIPILDYLDPAESAGLARFLVEMVALEEAIEQALVRYYASPIHRTDFQKHFLSNMTLGNKVERLGPVVSSVAPEATLVDDIRAVVEVRNAVAHRLPESDVEEDWRRDDPDDVEVFRVYRGKRRIVDARTLTDWAAAAEKLRMLVYAVRDAIAPVELDAFRRTSDGP